MANFLLSLRKLNVFGEVPESINNRIKLSFILRSLLKIALIEYC